MITTVGVKEGTIAFRGQKVWYRVAGTREALGRLPLLCLHGGPGLPHDYLTPLEAVAAAGRRVVFYDQLGCGNSDHPYDPSLWTINLFLSELAAIRKALGLVQVHLFGHFWGGMLALEYALTRPEGLASLILADAPASMRQFVAGTNRLRTELPPEVQCTLGEHEAAGTTEDPAYLGAVREFYRRHLCRLDPWPGSLTRSFDKWKQDPQVYLTMNGPSEFAATGILRDWDIVARLGEIRVPALITSGRYDEVTPDVIETVHHGIRGSEWVVFENSANMAHLEEPHRYMEVLEEFLTRVERQA